MPEGTTVISAEAWGLSAWTRTAKISTKLSGGKPQRYFLKVRLMSGNLRIHQSQLPLQPKQDGYLLEYPKCATGKLAKIHMWGEHYSSTVIASHVQDFGPHQVGKGDYFEDAGRHVYFYLQEFHDMDVQAAPDPSGLAITLAKLHQKATSPNGLFGYPMVTGRGTRDRTEQWNKIWAAQFTYLLSDLIKLDNQVNGPWPEYDAACRQLIEGVVPKLLGAL